MPTAAVDMLGRLAGNVPGGTDFSGQTCSQQWLPLFPRAYAGKLRVLRTFCDSMRNCHSFPMPRCRTAWPRGDAQVPRFASALGRWTGLTDLRLMQCACRPRHPPPCARCDGKSSYSPGPNVQLARNANGRTSRRSSAFPRAKWGAVTVPESGGNSPTWSSAIEV